MHHAEQIVTEARKWLGVKFHHQGRTRAAGVECLGLLVAVSQALGLERNGLPVARFDRRDYGPNPDPQKLVQYLEEALTRIAPEEIRAGDVGVFTIETRPQHLAIVSDYPVSGELGMIHAYAPARKVVEHRLDESWRARMVAAFRF
jgi:cell wall-associated NlpC family hydrolase